MAQTNTAVANMALGRIGSYRIENIENTNDQLASDCKFWLEQVLREIGGYPINALMAQREVAQDATSPEKGFAYRYKLPNAAMKVFRVNGYNANGTISYYTSYDVGSREPLWNIYGLYLHTDDATCFMEYTAYPETTAELPGYVNAGIACLMASYLATNIRNDKGGLSGQLRNEFEAMHLPKMLVIDGNERSTGPANVSRGSRMLGYRRMGTAPNTRYHI